MPGNRRILDRMEFEEDIPIHVARLTPHFTSRWHQRLGSVPSLESVNLAIRKGQCIKRGQELFKSINGRLYRYRTLTQVWNHRMGIIIWVDERSGKAVTVIVPKESLREERIVSLPHVGVFEESNKRKGERHGRDKGKPKRRAKRHYQ